MKNCCCVGEGGREGERGREGGMEGRRGGREGGKRIDEERRSERGKIIIGSKERLEVV